MTPPGPLDQPGPPRPAPPPPAQDQMAQSKQRAGSETRPPQRSARSEPVVCLSSRIHRSDLEGPHASSGAGQRGLLLMNVFSQRTAAIHNLISTTLTHPKQQQKTRTCDYEHSCFALFWLFMILTWFYSVYCFIFPCENQMLNEDMVGKKKNTAEWFEWNDDL